jgi:DNA-directed RNA polymerase II subunit RPB1
MGMVYNMKTRKLMDDSDLILFGDVFLDRITDIKTISDYKHEFVYDFSVAGNQTFMLLNGLFVHNTLNSFHSSGLSIATVVTGVPRFLELLNATKEPKMTSNGFVLNQEISTPKDIRKIIKNSLVFHTLNDLIVQDKIYVDNKDEEYWYGSFEVVFGNQFRNFKSCIKFILNTEKMFNYKIDMIMIKNKIENAYCDVHCVFSPLHIGQIDIFVDTFDIKIPDDLVDYFHEKDHISVYLQEVVKIKLLDIELCGLKNIKNYQYVLENNVWKIHTEGSNFVDLAAISYIDISSLSSNNMWDIYNAIGIEATREFLIEEFTSVVSSDGTFINPSHILLLVDIMTFQGIITSINRYGMKKDQIGVLSRASFEESLDQFCYAGFYSEKDMIKSVSANIMCGKRSIIGSGLCNIKMDWDVIEN